MTIHIENLSFDVIIGLLDFERDKPQNIIIDATINYNYSDKNFIDYADVTILMKNELKEKRYKLLEDALLGVKLRIFTSYPQIKQLTLKISKPDILDDCCVALSQSWAS